MLCEPFFTGSHQAWALGLAEHSRHRVRLVTQPGRFWKWRMQGGALTLADRLDALVAEHGRPDVVLVSDMVHLPALRGFAADALTGVPIVLYFHENQLTYPWREGVEPDHTYAMVNWLSAAVADRVIFNSAFHRDQFFDALPGFLERFPDEQHGHRIDGVRHRSEVIPVGVDLDRLRTAPVDRDPVTILWNHRWEHDKDPAAFFDALEALASTGSDFRVIVAGQRYEQAPAAFDRGLRSLAAHVVHAGTATADEYPALLRRADIVVSTARHDFFGVAVVEAIAAGCLPLLPRRLAYPELVPTPSPYLYDTSRDLVEALRWAVSDGTGRVAAACAAQAHVEQFGWPRVAPRYDALLAEAAGAGGR